MVVGSEGRGFDLAKELPEGLLGSKASADWKRVDEEADQGFEIGMVTAPDGDADGEVVLAAVAMQQQGQ